MDIQTKITNFTLIRSVKMQTCDDSVLVGLTQGYLDFAGEYVNWYNFLEKQFNNN